MHNIIPIRTKRSTKRPVIQVLKIPDSPRKMETPRLRPVKYDPPSDTRSHQPAVTFEEIKRPQDVGKRIKYTRPPTPSDPMAILQELEATAPEPLLPDRPGIPVQLLNHGGQRKGNLDEQNLTAIDREAQTLGVMTTTLENQPGNLQASKRSVGQGHDFRYLQKQLGFYRQEVALYKEYHSAYIELRAKAEEFHKFQRILSERLSKADDALRRYWAEHHGDGNEEDVVFRQIKRTLH